MNCFFGTPSRDGDSFTEAPVTSWKPDAVAIRWVPHEIVAKGRRKQAKVATKSKGETFGLIRS
jgi:hypothetical protein